MVGHQLVQQKLTYQYYSTIFLLMRLFQRVTAGLTYVERTLTVQSHTDIWTVSEHLFYVSTNHEICMCCNWVIKYVWVGVEIGKKIAMCIPYGLF